MTYQVTNISQNPLQLSDGKMLAPIGANGSKRVLDAVSAKDKDFEKRGWISIIEELNEAPTTSATAAPVRTDVKNEGVKK